MSFEPPEVNMPEPQAVLEIEKELDEMEHKAPMPVATSAAARAKRPRLSLSVRLEPGQDSGSFAHEVFLDGSYTPADRSHFARVAAAASSFIASAIADPYNATIGADAQAEDHGGTSILPGAVSPPQHIRPHFQQPSQTDSKAKSPMSADHRGPEDATMMPHDSDPVHTGLNHLMAQGGEPVANPTASLDPSSSHTWPAEVVASIERTLDEIGRFIAVMEALRQQNPSLQLVRFARPSVQPKASSTPVADPSTAQNDISVQSAPDQPRLPAATLRAGGPMLMAKRRALVAGADIITTRATAFKRWVSDENTFVNLCLEVRKHCGALRRAFDGSPLVDVGIGNFVQIERTHKSANAPSSAAKTDSVPESSSTPTAEEVDTIMDTDDTSGRDPTLRTRGFNTSDQGESNKIRYASVRTPSLITLTFRIRSVLSPTSVVPPNAEVNGNVLGASTVDENESQSRALIRQIRVARVSAFRQLTFERMSREAHMSPQTAEMTSNQISLVSGSGNSVEVARSVLVRSDSSFQSSRPGDGDHIFEASQDTSLLSLVAARASLILMTSSSSSQDRSVLSCLEEAAGSRCTVLALERVLDRAASVLRVRIRWSRGSSVPYQCLASVYASEFDGDGPSRLLATFEPLSAVNNSGVAHHSGQVRVTPAFGAVIAPPHDPRIRSRCGKQVANFLMSASQGPAGLYLDDVPRGYVCPVHGVEIVSTIAVLMCIRLLDALEAVARSGEGAVLDVDRQCFTVLVMFPRAGRTLRVKVWPKDSGNGDETPSTLVWLDDQRVESFPEFGSGRIVAWRKLVKSLAVLSKSEKGVSDVQMTPAGPKAEPVVRNGSIDHAY